MHPESYFKFLRKSATVVPASTPPIVFSAVLISYTSDVKTRETASLSNAPISGVPVTLFPKKSFPPLFLITLPALTAGESDASLYPSNAVLS